MTPKIPALTDAPGKLVDFCLMPGHAHDLRETDTLICELSAGHLLADKAFDADWLRNALPDRGIPPVMPPKSNRKLPAEFDKETRKWRHLIENHFGKVKENRRDSHALLQDRPELQSLRHHCGNTHSDQMNVNNP